MRGNFKIKGKKGKGKGTLSGSSFFVQLLNQDTLPTCLNK